MSIESRRWTIVGTIALAYFVTFPNDLQAILAPAREVASLTIAISPWAYVVLAAGIIAWAIVRCFARPREVGGL
jgi:hypothetical protein